MIPFLVAWSLLAFLWWGIALTLLSQGRRVQPRTPFAGRSPVSIFKPIPPISSDQHRQALIEAIGSFVAQLGAGDQLVIGLETTEAPRWTEALTRWRDSGTSGRIIWVEQDTPRQHANPKVSWLEVLANSATGSIWIWSDADVTVPPGFLNEICQELAASGANAVSAPYKLQPLAKGAGVLDALFVNLEMLPGVLLLGRLGRQDFAYGAATVFSAQAFRAQGDWKLLGSSLADDHKLGELLQPVALGRTLVATSTAPSGWGEALQHYYRWQKTVRWCRPIGYGALLALLPILGWTVTLLVSGPATSVLGGLLSVSAGEMLVGFIGCRSLGCRLPALAWLGLILWPFARAATWLLVWLPFPVIWSGRKRAWFSPTQN